MIAVVAAVAELEPVVVAFELQRCGHFLIGERPTAVQVVEVIRSVLQEDSQRLLFLLANQRWIDVPAPNVREAADVAEHLAKLIGPLPRDRERADAARTDTADRALVGIVGQIERMFLHGERQELVEQEPSVLVAQRVVFKRFTDGMGDTPSCQLGRMAWLRSEGG